MSAAHLRAARSTDAGAVGGILSEFVDATDWMPRLHSRAQDIGFAGQMIDRGWVTVAEQNGVVAGFSACRAQDIQAFYIARHSRRCGIGSALLKDLQSKAEQLSLWTFQANAAAQAFYRAHGFVVVEQTDGAGNDEGLPDSRMEWTRGAA